MLQAAASTGLRVPSVTEADPPLRAARFSYLAGSHTRLPFHASASWRQLLPATLYVIGRFRVAATPANSGPEKRAQGRCHSCSRARLEARVAPAPRTSISLPPPISYTPACSTLSPLLVGRPSWAPPPLRPPPPPTSAGQGGGVRMRGEAGAVRGDQRVPVA